MASRFVVFLHSARRDRVFQAANLCLTASSMGRASYLFLFHQALAAWLDDAWDDLAVGDGDDPWSAAIAERLDLSNMPPIGEILDQARRQPGGLTVCACSTSVRLLDRDPAEVRGRVDEIVGMATMLDLADGAQVLYV